MANITEVRKSFNNPFIALRHRNFRFYWTGMCISLVGTWMQNTAQPWLAYSLTDSPFLLGLVGVLQFTPVLLFSLFAGTIIDRFPKKRIIMATQSASLVTALILAILVLTGNVRYWHILVLAAVLGMVNTFDMPARQSFVIELVGREDLMNAIALNSSVFNVARIIGPALAGLVMGYFGIAFCFFANSLSFAAVIIGLIFVKPLDAGRLRKSGDRILRETAAGLKYVFNTPVLFRTLLVTAIVGTFTMNFSVLVPVFAKVVLLQKETGFGFLMSFMGIGSFTGAMLIATMSKVGPRNLILKIMPFLISAFLIATALTGSFVVTGICLAFTGLSFVMFSSTANSTMQLNTRDEYRGRVMSAYTLVFSGSTPLGNLYAGIISDKLGPRWGFAACGAITALLVLLMFLVRTEKRSLA